MKEPANMPFKLRGFKIITEGDGSCACRVEASVKIEVGGITKMTVAEGDTQEEALNKAMREALSALYGRKFDLVVTPPGFFECNFQGSCTMLVNSFMEQITGGRYGQGD